MTLTKTKNGQIEESASVIKSRIKKNYAEMQEVAEQATYNLRVAIGRDLVKLKRIVSDGEWTATMRDIGIPQSSSYNWMTIAKDKESLRSKRFTSTTEHLRHLNPNVALPRQKVDEQPVRNILAGIDSKIFAERAKNEVKEGRLKKSMALELVDAGYRALSIKAHSDKGGSDDAMRRLGEVKKALKAAINDGAVIF